jgi:hypothetical protein
VLRRRSHPTLQSPRPIPAEQLQAAQLFMEVIYPKKLMNFQKSRGGGNAKSIFISKTALSEHDAYNLKHRIPTASEGCSSNEGR